jgi:hypothetical protein
MDGRTDKTIFGSREKIEKRKWELSDKKAPPLLQKQKREGTVCSDTKPLQKVRFSRSLNNARLSFVAYYLKYYFSIISKRAHPTTPIYLLTYQPAYF